MNHETLDELSVAELAGQHGEGLPAREVMALLNLAIPVSINLGAALNVLASDSSAEALAGQLVGLDQS